MKKLFVIVAALSLLFTVNSYAFFADTDVEHDSVAIGLGGQNNESNTSITGVKTLDQIQGYVAGYANRQTTDGEVESEAIIGRLQGGFDINAFRVRGYTEGTRDIVQEIDLKIETGYFIESPSYTWQSIEFSAGAGNFVERRDLDDAIGRDAADAEVSVGWLTFVTAELGHLSTIFRFKPELNAEDFITEVAVAFNKDITERIGLQFTALSQYDTASVTDTRYNNTYLIQFVYTPE